MSDPRSLTTRPDPRPERLPRSRAASHGAPPPGRRGVRMRRLGALAGIVLLGGLGAAAPSAGADATAMVDLGDAATYAVISGASVGNTVSAAGAKHTTLRGDLGVKVSTQPTGFPPGVVTGQKHIGDGAAVAAHKDLVAAYVEVAGRTGGTPLAGALAGETVLPGLHTIAGAVSNTTTLTLDAQNDPNAVFVFQVNGAMAMAAGSKVVLTGGAQASRIFWQVNGAGAVGANATFAGTLMALDAVALGNGTVFNGRAFARNGALTLDANDVYGAPPKVTIAGGPAVTTPDSTPTISGTTSAESADALKVTVDGTPVDVALSGSAWSVTSAPRENGTYSVVASVTDGAGNVTTATQDLTVDTTLPIVTLDGGSAALTNDPTPTISGTSDVAPDSVVRVTVGAQTLTAIVNSAGAWNVTPATLSDDAYDVAATVEDPAGNDGTATQVLVVDTAPPDLTITGGTTALTNDPTPTITGTAAVPEGTDVVVALSDETLQTTVDENQVWSVTAAGQSEGPHRIVVDVADEAGNPTRASQNLTVDTIAPVVGIDGGETATTTDGTPTITGTSDAAPDTVVTVTIGGQTRTTLLQADGTWNVTPRVVGPGTWTVDASVPDPAQNVGRATQGLTIGDPTPAPGTGGDGGTTTPPAGGTGGDGGTTTPPAGGTGDTGSAGAGGTGATSGADGAAGGTGATGTPGTGGTTGTGGAATPAQVAAAVLAASPAGKATVAPSTRQRLRGTALSLATKLSAPAAGRVVATLRGSVRIKSVKRAIALTTTTAKIAAGKSATPVVRIKGTKKAAAAAYRKIRAAARKGTAVTATITVRVVDAAGHVRTVTRTVKLVK